MITETIRRLFRENGGNAYFGEPVTQAEHALQAAHLAEQAGSDDYLVVAALLHDIGHLLHTEGEDIANRGVDSQHEHLGDRWLRRYFGPKVTEPVRLHVAAKRYLCTTEPEYYQTLSEASRQSLALQGGPFTASERQQFEAGAHCADSVRLRRWDDEAKVAHLDVPGLEHYMARVARAVTTDDENT